MAEQSEKEIGTKKTNRRNKEEDIMRAAVRLFSQYGYPGTTTMAIAQEARVSEKTLFNYFHTKQELYDKTVCPMMKTLIQEKVENSLKTDGGIYGLLHDLYLSKIKLVNEKPEMLKLTIHEFLMNQSFRKQMGEIWNTAYLPSIVKQLDFSEEAKEKYGSELDSALTRAIVSFLLTYAIDKIYLRPNEKFDDETEIALMLELLCHGIDGLQKENWEAHL